MQHKIRLKSITSRLMTIVCQISRRKTSKDGANSTAGDLGLSRNRKRVVPISRNNPFYIEPGRVHATLRKSRVTAL
jgi:hypothetical protein